MKPSELKPVDIAFFARKITESSEFEGLSDLEKKECEDALEASTAVACAYTGLDMRGMDNYPDITYAIKVMATEMLDNRNITAQYNVKNPLVYQILDLHSANLLPIVGREYEDWERYYGE